MLTLRAQMRLLTLFLAITLSTVSAVAIADTADKVYLKCTPDPNEKLPGGIDVLLDKKKLEGVFFPINETAKFQETDTEYVNRVDIDGKLSFLFAINKFTLRYRSYNSMAVLVHADPNLSGQCIIQDKKL
jgi:hypothetical protein